MIPRILSNRLWYGAVALLLAAGVASSQAMEEPKDLLDQAIRQMAAYTQNAKIKVMNQAGGLGIQTNRPGSLPSKAKLSPAGRCCNENLNIIRDASGRIREIIRVLRYELKNQNRLEGKDVLRSMSAHLDEADLRIRQFAGTGEKDLAVKFLEQAQSALSRLQEAKTGLNDCCDDLLPKMPPKDKEKKAKNHS